MIFGFFFPGTENFMTSPIIKIFTGFKILAILTNVVVKEIHPVK